MARWLKSNSENFQIEGGKGKGMYVRIDNEVITKAEAWLCWRTVGGGGGERPPLLLQPRPL